MAWSGSASCVCRKKDCRDCVVRDVVFFFGGGGRAGKTQRLAPRLAAFVWSVLKETAQLRSGKDVFLANGY